MPSVLILSGPNHGFDKSAPIIHDFLSKQGSVSATLTDDKSVLASPALSGHDVCLLGTGFTRRERQADGAVKLVNELTDAQARGLFDFVRGGKGLIGIHGTGWWIGGEAVNLIGGHANWHPPRLEFSVQVEDREHPVTQGLDDFTVQDEIYMSAWDPSIHVLATATWSDKKHPMAWTHAYGKGRVFYTALGHGPGTFGNPAVQKMLANAALWAAGKN